jgi:hypothetical protein
LAERTELRVVVASESSAGGLKNALPTGRWLALERSGHLPGSRCELDEVRAVTEQLEPERARSCRNAITMASVMVDEIRLRAHARPLDSDDTT